MAFDQVHDDEKWFYITEKVMRVYLTAREKAKGDMQICDGTRCKFVVCVC